MPYRQSPRAIERIPVARNAYAIAAAGKNGFALVPGVGFMVLPLIASVVVAPFGGIFAALAVYLGGTFLLLASLYGVALVVRVASRFVHRRAIAVWGEYRVLSARRTETDSSATLCDFLDTAASRFPVIRMMCALERARLSLEAGALEDAAWLLARLQAGRTSPRCAFPQFHALLDYCRTLLYTLTNDLAAAERALSDAQATGKSWDNSRHFTPRGKQPLLEDCLRGNVLYLQALVAARKDDAEAFLAITEGPWIESLPIADRDRWDYWLGHCGALWSRGDVALNAPQLRQIHLLRAFVLSSFDDPDCEPELRAALERAQPVRPGEYDALAAHWPELDEFLHEQTWRE
jgi:hypothetical protein